MKILQTIPKLTFDEERTWLDAAWKRVLDSGHYILGSEVETFEQFFANYIGVAHGVGVANGTQAVEIALRAVGVQPGDRVATVSHTAVATVNAIRACGAWPVFIDVDPATALMDLSDLAHIIASEPLRAIVIVHLYGNVVNPEPLQKLCQDHAISLIEDCAQAHGAAWNERQVGSLGDIAAFSFYPTKNLGALGDAGMVVTNNPEFASQARLLREYGWHKRYVSDVVGMNSRLDALQAALLNVLLQRLDERNDRRRAIAALYDAHLKILPVEIPCHDPQAHHVYHQYVIQTDDRDALARYLEANDIGTAVHYPVPVHQQPAYQQFSTRKLPRTERIIKRILSLPMYPQLEPDSVNLIVTQIKSFFER